MRRQAAHTAGAVYVEFLIVFFPIFLLFLGTIQAALIGGAKLVVQHAAYTAARSAIVVLDDDPASYDMTPRGCLLSKKGGQGEDSNSQLEKLLGAVGQLLEGTQYTSYQKDIPEQQRNNLAKVRSGGPRLSPIRLSAYMKLLSIAPDVSKVMDHDSIEKALGSVNLGRVAGGLLYCMGASSVTFPTSPDGYTFKTSFSPGEIVHTRVTFLYHCTVPLVSKMMCKSMVDLMMNQPLSTYKELAQEIIDGKVDYSQYSQWKARIQAEKKKINAMQKPYNEVILGAEAPGVQMLAFNKSRFAVLQAVASLPYQSAKYKYKSEADALSPTKLKADKAESIAKAAEQTQHQSQGAFGQANQLPLGYPGKDPARADRVKAEAAKREWEKLQAESSACEGDS